MNNVMQTLFRMWWGYIRTNPDLSKGVGGDFLDEWHFKKYVKNNSELIKVRGWTCSRQKEHEIKRVGDFMIRLDTEIEKLHDWRLGNSAQNLSCGFSDLFSSPQNVTFEKRKYIQFKNKNQDIWGNFKCEDLCLINTL